MSITRSIKLLCHPPPSTEPILSFLSLDVTLQIIVIKIIYHPQEIQNFSQGLTIN